MKKNKFGIFLVLGLLLIPLLKLQAEDDDFRVGTGTKVGSEDSHQSIKLGAPATVRSLLGKDDDDEREVENESERENEGTKIRSSTSMQTEVKISSEEKAKMQVGIDTRKKEILEKVVGMRAEVKVKLDANAQERVKKLVSNIFNMLTNQIDRLTNVDARIGEKIAAQKAAGVDVTLATTQYTKAQAALAQAKIDVAATNSASIDQTSIATSKEAFRALVKVAEDSIKACGREYMQILPLLNTETKVDVKANSSTNTNQ